MRDLGTGRATGRKHRFDLPVALHVALLMLGSAYLLIDAFHGNVWFDESYSVAIANHPLLDIVRIGAADVHPVLYYVALRALQLAFGQNVLVYRLFTLAGSIALAALGIGMVRRDFGARVGAIFSFLALFCPYVSHMSIEIRMYSWCALTVMVCFLYGRRIYLRCLRDGRDARIPRGWWIGFHAASLASASLHYFGTISAFLIFVALIVGFARMRPARRAWGGLIGGGAIQLACYLPWLIVMIVQVVKVEHGFWISVSYPAVLVQAMLFPFLDPWVVQGVSRLSGASSGAGIASLYGGAPGALPLILAAVLFCLMLLACRRDRRCLPGFALFVGLAGLTLLLSAIGTPIFQYRYLYVALGPLLLSWCVALCPAPPFGTAPDEGTGVREGAAGAVEAASPVADGPDGIDRRRGPGMRVLRPAVLVAVLVLSVIGKISLSATVYSPQNAEPMAELEKAGVGTAKGPELWSQDSSSMGLIAVSAPKLRMHYVDRWTSRDAYEAYAPDVSFHPAGVWGSHRSGERFIVLSRFGGSKYESHGRRAIGQARKDLGASFANAYRTVRTQAVFRPYEQVWYVIGLVEAR